MPSWANALQEGKITFANALSKISTHGYPIDVKLYNTNVEDFEWRVHNMDML